MEFQSMTVLGINEYFHDFRQFLFVAIWINWLCLDEQRTGRRIVCVGMARRPQRAWCTMQTLLTFLLSSNDSHSSSFFHFCDTAPTFIVACYETSTRVSKWSYQHLILTPNTWVSLTIGLHFETFLWGVLVFWKWLVYRYIKYSFITNYDGKVVFGVPWRPPCTNGLEIPWLLKWNL